MTTFLILFFKNTIKTVQKQFQNIENNLNLRKNLNLEKLIITFLKRNFIKLYEFKQI